MAIISQQESFLLKFRQENSQEDTMPVDVTVTKNDGIFVVELKGNKKGSAIKIDLESFKEIINYIDSKVNVRVVNVSGNIHSDYLSKSANNYTKVLGNSNMSFANNAGANGPSQLESASQSESVGNLNDLLNDIEGAQMNSGGIYASQADLIISNGIGISPIGE